MTAGPSQDSILQSHDAEATGSLDPKGKGKSAEYSSLFAPVPTAGAAAGQSQDILLQSYLKFRNDNLHVFSPFEQVTEQLGELLDHTPPELLDAWIKYGDPNERIKSVFERALRCYSKEYVAPEFTEIHRATFANFKWFCGIVSETHGIVDPNEVENVKSAYKFIEDINPVVYMERLCHILRWCESKSYKVKETGVTDLTQLSIAQYDREPYFLLIYVHEHQNPECHKELSTIHGDLWLFRMAFEYMLLVEYLDDKGKRSSILAERFNNYDLSSLVRAENRRLAQEGKIFRIRTEGVNWGHAMRVGRTWKNWCSAFSRRGEKDGANYRGMLLLLCVMMKPDDFTYIATGRSWHLAGEEMSKNQIMWIAEYIKTYFPKFMHMVDLMDFCADEIYEYGFISVDSRRELEDELRAILAGKGGRYKPIM